jgi:hypothetical protein
LVLQLALGKQAPRPSAQPAPTLTWKAHLWLPCSPLSATGDLNEAVDASMDDGLKVFDEMDTRYAFSSFSSFLYLVAHFADE